MATIECTVCSVAIQRLTRGPIPTRCRACVLKAKKRRYYLKHRDRTAWVNKHDPIVRARRTLAAQRSNIKRSALIALMNDGTLTPEVVAGLFASARVCPYCHASMRSVEKSLDHVIPLSRGGAHSITNVVVCCKWCNTSKGMKLLTTSVPEQLIHGGA